MNRKGVTIVELVIYIALFGLVFLLVSKQFRGLVNNYSSGHRSTRQMTDARDIVGLMVREIRNTGLKTYFTSPTQTAIDYHVCTSYPSDKSSFIHTEGNPGDQLTIEKLTLDNNANKDKREKIRYFLDGTTLKRELWVDGSSYSSESVVAENVYGLQFSYGINGSNTVLVPELPITSSGSSWDAPYSYDNNPDVNKTSSQITLTFNNAATSYIKYANALTISKNSTYAVHLQVVPSGGFPGNLDSCSFSFKDQSDNLLGSEGFLPQSGDIYLSITAHHGSAADNAYAYLEYDVNGSGVLNILGVEVRCVEKDSYTWTYNPTTSEKEFVRAIRLHLLTRTRDKASTEQTDAIPVGNISFTPSGEYAWRLYTETIQIPNNGVF